MKPAELRRHQNRGKYDLESVSSVFADSFMAHVSYVDDGLPQCLPMIALFHTIGDETAVYLHGHPSARLMELVKQSGGADGELPEKDKIKVCIAATKVDGLVLSSAPNGHTFNYQSAVIHGECSLVQDRSIKQDIMRGVTNHIVAGRWEDVNPVSSFQISLVCVVRVDILSLSLKSRSGVPGIQPRNIEKDGKDRDEPVWTGVVPLYDVLDEPVASGLTDAAKVPEGLRTFIGKRNEKHRNYSLRAAKI
ncbi:related to flavin-nucleotide-binding protein [Phialocephala subalpina]|uniref:Related to flavin-nucleotide-binding protein n=1 Tax=Phialocephala subalpina TaxID=576137 RepID=A0A1L7XWH9_9HELO|nr:related to flavin-nucleotide-binding protein [Phialocephala subalpina]